MASPKSKPVQAALSVEPPKTKEPVKAVVLEDFVFQVSLYPGRSGHTQLFRRKTIVTGTMLIKQMLAAGKPIQITE